MPVDSQLLYFHLILRADDDGIVEAYPVIKLINPAPDSVKILIARGFLVELNEDQVMVITDWKEHNTIRPDRKVNSIYLPLLKKVLPEYEVVSPEPRSDVRDNSKRVGGPSTVGLSKGKLSKYNNIVSKKNKDEITSYTRSRFIKEKDSILKDALTKYPAKNCKQVMEDFIDKTSYKDYHYKNYKLAYFKWCRDNRFTTPAIDSNEIILEKYQ